MEGFSISNQMNSRNPFEKEKAICKKPFELSWLSLYGFCLLSWVFGLVVFAEFANSLLPHFTFNSYHFESYNALARYLQGLSLLLDIYKHFLQFPNIHKRFSSTGSVWLLFPNSNPVYFLEQFLGTGEYVEGFFMACTHHWLQQP